MYVNPLAMNNRVNCIQKGTTANLTRILIIQTVLAREIPQPFQAITRRVYQISSRTFYVFSKSVFPNHRFEAI
jgi:hypothetical protein